MKKCCAISCCCDLCRRSAVAAAAMSALRLSMPLMPFSVLPAPPSSAADAAALALPPLRFASPWAVKRPRERSEPDSTRISAESDERRRKASRHCRERHCRESQPKNSRPAFLQPVVSWPPSPCWALSRQSRREGPAPTRADEALQHHTQRHQSLAEWQLKRKERQCR